MSNPEREVEYDCVANSKFEQDGSATMLAPKNATIRLSPSDKNRRRWMSDAHFHADFCLPDAVVSSEQSLLLQFEGRAREGIAVSLSSAPKFKGTEVLLGTAGNTSTVLAHKKKKRISAPGRVCREDVWVNYWICWDESNKLYAGVGTVPGEQCIAILDTNRKTVEEKEEEGKMHNGGEEKDKDAVVKDEQEVEDGTDEKNVDEALSDQKSKENAPEAPPTMRYVGVRNAGTADRQAPKPLHVRNFSLTAVPPDLAAKLNALDADKLDMIILGEEELQRQDSTLTLTDREAIELLCKYRDECVKAKARSVKFGVPYQPPALTAAMPWSQARRLRANPVATSGFVTGMDLQDDAEKEKQEKRKARFGILTETSSSSKGGDKQEETATDMEMSQAPALPVEQAWDKEELVRSQRVDPPPLLWKNPPLASANDDTTPKDDEFRMEEEQAPVVLSEKIHIFSMDWAAFKQIRTNDILAYFSVYGPTYVEWLGDLSCNVLFEDKYSAARAMENMSQEIPSPPPTTLNGGGDGDDDDDDSGLPDLGRMGWRLGKAALRKVANDRYGRRGTTARLLMRSATSRDILVERPNKWPKPPQGFTTKRVLGPESDLVGRGKKKKGKKRDHKDASNVSKPVTTEGLLSVGLSSGRAGFSVEEMEAERAKKRSKVSES